MNIAAPASSCSSRAGINITARHPAFSNPPALDTLTESSALADAGQFCIIDRDLTMSSSPNGQNQAYRDPTRRLRFDDLASIVVRNNPGARPSPMSAMIERGHSGRRFVLVAGFSVLVIWGTLFLVFRDWRARYRERALYGAAQVVPPIDRLRSIVPPDVDPAVWRDAVDQTRAMLTTVTGSNLLDVEDIDKLRAALDQHADRAVDRPGTAVRELADIWDEIAERGEFLFNDSRSLSGIRHPRPKTLPPRPGKPPVDSAAPDQ